MANSTFPKDVLAELETHCRSRGTFNWVQVMEPDQQPGEGIGCAIWLNRLQPARNASGLDTTTVRLEYSIRLYKSLTTFPQETIDTDMLTACADLMMSFSAGFSLQGMARAVDLLGAHGPGLEMAAGYIEQDGNQYRIMTITVPVVVNDVWDQEA